MDIRGLAQNRQLTSTERGSLATIKKNSVTDLVQLFHQNTKAKQKVLLVVTKLE